MVILQKLIILYLLLLNNLRNMLKLWDLWRWVSFVFLFLCIFDLQYDLGLTLVTCWWFLQTIIPPVNIVNSRFLDLLNHLLKWDPAERYTVKEALRHPFFSIDINDEEVNQTRWYHSKRRCANFPHLFQFGTVWVLQSAMYAYKSHYVDVTSSAALRSVLELSFPHIFPPASRSCHVKSYLN